jgi:hypothetical protein
MEFQRVVEEPKGNSDPDRGTRIVDCWCPTLPRHLWVPPSPKQKLVCPERCVLGVFTLSFSMASYILGSMQSSGVKSSMYPIWAISLFMLHACTDSITAYSLDDNKQQARLAYQAYMYLAYALLLLISARKVYTVPLFLWLLSLSSDTRKDLQHIVLQSTHGTSTK